VATPSRYLCLMLALVPSAAAAASIPLSLWHGCPVSKLGSVPMATCSRGRRKAGRGNARGDIDVGRAPEQANRAPGRDAKLRGLAWADTPHW